MKRKIEFRGKARNILYNGAEILHGKGEWLYGDLIHQDGEVFIAPVDRRYPIGTSFTSFAVAPDTIGQFTGLKDKNGVEIYEGDILQFHATKTRRVTFIAEYDTTYGVGYRSINFRNDIPCSPNRAMYRNRREITEIVGNIHENLELLKGGAQ